MQHVLTEIKGAKLASENLTTVDTRIVKIFSIALDILTWLIVISFVAYNNRTTFFFYE